MGNNIEDVGTYENVKNQIRDNNQEFIILPNDSDLGIIDSSKSLENLSIVVNHAKNALANRFYIEFLSLKIQYIEYFLRMYWIVKNPNRGMSNQLGKKFFGTLINECQSFGFDTDLIVKLKDFNEQRVNAIHNFLMGGITEEDLKNVCEKYSKLGNEVFNYVLDQIGTYIDDVDKIPQSVGTMIFTRLKK